MLRDGWKDIGTVLLAALTLDVAYELIVFRWVYPVQAMIVTSVLAVIPYALIRRPVTHFAERLSQR